MPKIRLEIVTVERPLLNEEVDYISAPGVDGVIGILPRHAPLVTALTVGELRYNQDGDEHAFAIGGGFMEVRPDHVTVLADTAERAQEIDELRAEQARERARRLLQDTPRSEVEFVRLEQSLRRAELRLRVARRKRGSGRTPKTGES